MTSPHSGYPHQGRGPSSYYQPSPPPTHHVYGTHSPSPNSYQYLYPTHPHPQHINSHPQHHPSPRINGRGGSYGNRNNHGHPHMYPQNFHPQQSYPHPLALHAPHPQHPQQHPVKYGHPYTPPYPYPSPTSATQYSPSWQPQQSMSPLPKQLAMQPPRGVSPAYYEPPAAPQPSTIPTSVPELPLVDPTSKEASETELEQPTETSTQQDRVTEEIVDEKSVVEPAEQSQETQVPEVSESEKSIPLPSSSPISTSNPYTTMGSISTNSTIGDVSQSHAQITSAGSQQQASAFNPIPSFAIWSRRPGNPSRAPGIIISPRACPPSDIVQQALEERTPPPSPKIVPASLPEVIDESETTTTTTAVVAGISSTKESESSYLNSAISSSSVTEITDAPTLPGSPISTTTSVSINADASNSNSFVTSTSKTLDPSSASTSTEIQKNQIPIPTSSSTITQTTTGTQTSAAALTPASATTPAPVPSKPAPPKSWAALFNSSSSSTRSSLPKSSVIGFSIPAAVSSNNNLNFPVAAAKKMELLNLLTTGAIGKQGGDEVARIRTRGLINSGNMCFANAVLQVLVYCDSFQKLFCELGRLLNKKGLEKSGGDKKEREKEREKEKEKSQTPFVDATIEFLREFVEEDRDKEKKKSNNKKNGGGGKGKEREREREMSGNEDDDWPDSFLPSYVYDAMKEKKRFESMRGGQQEDAEEFLGFYLDTLEEELLHIQNSLTAAPPPPPSSTSKNSKNTTKTTTAVNGNGVEEKEENEPPEEDGWMEVGKRNKTVVTRTIKGVESPITRMFGGKFRSTLKAQGQKDSVVVEDWRSLRLDIQRESIHTIQDALSHITQPQPVQLSNATKPGITIDASQRVLIESLPPVLVLHVKRFCYDVDVGGVVKVMKQVMFGPELDVGSDMMAPLPATGKRVPPTKYKLFGALYHHGHSASGGHYTLDVLHPNRYPGARIKEGWVRIDDELVSDVRSDDVFGANEESRNAYLLFYKRVGSGSGSGR